MMTELSFAENAGKGPANMSGNSFMMKTGKRETRMVRVRVRISSAPCLASVQDMAYSQGRQLR